MGAIFRRSKKKPQPSAKVPKIPDTISPNQSPENEGSPPPKKLNEKKSRKDKKQKITPIAESLNELNTNENKEKESAMEIKKLEDKFSNISSIQDVTEPEKSAIHTKTKKSPKKDKKAPLEKNDTVDENNEQMENNPNFFQVFMKDPVWANKNIANKLAMFNWPEKGFVEIKAQCFEIVYDFHVKGFRVIRNSENMNSSILSWVRIDNEEYFSFDLKDINTFNLKTGQVQQNKAMNQGLKFGVDLQGNYVKNKNISNKKKRKNITFLKLGLDSDQLDLKSLNPEIIEYIDTEIESIWTGLVGSWVAMDFTQESDKVYSKHPYFGTEAVSLSREEIYDSEEMVDFLISKFKDKQDFQALLKSRFLIPNDLKKWDEYDIRPEVFDPRLLHFYLMEKNSNFSGLVEVDTTRPFIINIEHTKKMIFEYNGDLFADVSQSLKMMLVLWNDKKDTQKEEYILSEASNFQDLCMENLTQLVIEMSGIPTLPMNYRAKPPQQEFELRSEENYEKEENNNEYNE